MTPLQQFLNAMLAADVALQMHATDTPAARAYRELLHLTTAAGHLAMEGKGPTAEWRARVTLVLSMMCEAPSPFLPEPTGHPAATCEFCVPGIDNCTH